MSAFYSADAAKQNWRRAQLSPSGAEDSSSTPKKPQAARGLRPCNRSMPVRQNMKFTTWRDAGEKPQHFFDSVVHDRRANAHGYLIV